MFVEVTTSQMCDVFWGMVVYHKVTLFKTTHDKRTCLQKSENEICRGAPNSQTDLSR